MKQATVLLLAIVIIIGSVLAISIFWVHYQQQQAEQYAENAVKSAFSYFPTYAPSTPAPTSNYQFSTPQPTLNLTVAPTMPRILIASTSNVLNGGTLYRIPLVASVQDSPTSVTFTTDNILLNGKSSSSYGDYAPKLYNAPILASPYLISQLTLDQHGGGNTFEIWLIEGQGGPWVSDTTVIITIQTDTAQGSTTVTLP